MKKITVKGHVEQIRYRQLSCSELRHKSDDVLSEKETERKRERKGGGWIPLDIHIITPVFSCIHIK